MNPFRYLLYSFFFSYLCFSEPVNLALLPLESKTLDTLQLQFIQNHLRSEFVKNKSFHVLEIKKLNDLIKEKGFQSSFCNKPSCQGFASIEGVDQFLEGYINFVDDKIVFFLRLINGNSSTILKEVNLESPNNFDLLVKNGLPKLIHKLQHKDNEKLTTIDPNHFNKWVAWSSLLGSTLSFTYALYQNNQAQLAYTSFEEDSLKNKTTSPLEIKQHQSSRNLSYAFSGVLLGTSILFFWAPWVLPENLSLIPLKNGASLVWQKSF